MRKGAPGERVLQLCSLLVLLAFPLVVVALVAVVATTAWQTSGWVRLVCQVVLVGLVPTSIWALIESIRYRPEPDEGLALTRSDHPRLWEQLDDVAAVLGVAPPGRVLLTLDADASVCHHGSGADGYTHLKLGLPLLATYTVEELRATLGHEFGHVAGGDTVLSARLERASVFLRTLRQRSSLWTRWFFAVYALLFTLVDAAASRAAEARADAAAFAVAPAQAAASGLRKDVAAAATWGAFLAEALPKMDLAQRRASLLEGHAMAEAAFADETRAYIDAELAASRSLWDTHPPTGQRIAACERAADTGPTGPAVGPALALVDLEWLLAREPALHGLELPQAPWDEIEDRAARTVVSDQSLRWLEQLTHDAALSAPSFGAFLELAASIRPVDLARRLGGDPARGVDDPDVRDLLAVLVSSALIQAGIARGRWPWNEDLAITRLDGTDTGGEVESLVSRLLAGPAEVVAVRDELVSAGLDLTARPGDGRSVPCLLGIATRLVGPWPGLRDGVYWSTGLAFVPAEGGLLSRVVDRDDDRARIAALAGTSLEDLASDPAVRWVSRDEIAAARLSGLATTAIDLRLRDGSLLVIRGTAGSVETDPAGDDLEEALRGLLRSGDWERASASRDAGRGGGPALPWVLRDNAARVAAVLAVLGCIGAWVAADGVAIHRALSDPSAVVRVEATVESPPDDYGLVVVSVDHPRLPDTIEVSEDVVADPDALRSGHHLVLLVNPADPENQVIEDGRRTAESVTKWGVGSAVVLLTAAGSALFSRRRYRATHGRRPRVVPEHGEIADV